MSVISIKPAHITLFALLVPSAALSEFRYDTANGGEMLFYGQLDPAYLAFDDGVSTTSNIVDNTNSNSRVGFWYRTDTDYGGFSVNLETALGFRPSALLSQNNTPDAINWRRTSIRKVEAIWNVEGAGTFSVGQGSMSTDGVASKDLSGTTLVLYNSVPDTAGAFRFRTSAGALSTKTIAQAFGSYDGARKTRVRYDTPSFNGFKLSVSYGEEVLAERVNQKVTDIAVTYAGDFGGNKLVAGIGYSHNDFATAATRKDTVASISYLHTSGFNLTLAAGDRNTSGHYAYGKIGYRVDWFAAGTTSLGLDYYDGSDKTGAGSSSRSVGIGVVQAFDRQRVEAYFGYREYSLSEPGVSYRDASSVMVGARWKF